MASFSTRMVGSILLAACLIASKGATVHACGIYYHSMNGLG